MCQELTSSRCRNNLAQLTSCSFCNSKTTELQLKSTSNPLELPPCEGTSLNGNPSLPAAPCLFPQTLLPQSIQFPPSSFYPTINQAMGIVRPIFKNTPLNEGCDYSPSMDTITPEIKTSSNLSPASMCAICKASYIIPQQQCTNSVTGVKPLQSNIIGATEPYAAVNKAGDLNFAPSSSTNPSQMLNSLQQSPKHSFQLPEETTLPTALICGQKPNSSPTAATYSVFTDSPNSNLCTPYYSFQNAPSIMGTGFDPINITPVSTLPGSSCFPVVSTTPTETSIVQKDDKLDINVENYSSAVVLPEENYGNIKIVNSVNSENGNSIDKHAIALDSKSGAADSHWPINLVINVPPVNVPAPSVMILPTPLCSSALSEPAPVVPSFVSPPMPPIIVNSSKSKFTSLLPIILTSLLRNRITCGGDCSCNCGCKSIPVPYPIPISTNCPIINTGSEGRRKSRSSKSDNNEG